MQMQSKNHVNPVGRELRDTYNMEVRVEKILAFTCKQGIYDGHDNQTENDDRVSK